MLTRARISFETLHDDKDHDSKIKVRLRVGNKRIASKEWFGNGLVFQHNRKTDPFDLDVDDPNLTRAEVEGGITVEMEFDPEGNDTWGFWFDVSLTFSDAAPIDLASRPRHIIDGPIKFRFGCVLSDEHTTGTWSATPIG